MLKTTPRDLLPELPPEPTRWQEASRDLIEGARRCWLWASLALHDVQLRYRGSVFGPFWLTLTTAITIVALGLVYARLFRMELGAYFPFLMIGLIVWQFISGLVSESCQTFLSAGSVIQQVPMPFSVHALRVVVRNLIVLGHTALLIPFGLFYFHIPLSFSILWVVPGLVLIALNGFFLCLSLGMLSARYRDVPPVVASFLQVAFLITPVFWSPELLGSYQGLALYNPLFAAVDLVRAPLLGTATGSTSWWVMLSFTASVVAVSFLCFALNRSRIPYWV